ncbi:MAG TPA: 2-oxo-4-hydroxy-4-carboxy-5-ureidoimidazoline decarboxylase [Pseudonocardiaceae bacterium]
MADRGALPRVLREGPRRAAARELLACCASTRWAARVAQGLPYEDLAALRRASDEAFAELRWPDLVEAMAAHPRIGERAGGADREAAWSRAEQAGAATTDEEVAAALVAGNAEYERRFGHVFLIRATGRDAREILAALRERLNNDLETERRVVREQLAEIVALRLDKLIEEDA